MVCNHVRRREGYGFQVGKLKISGVIFEITQTIF